MGESWLEAGRLDRRHVFERQGEELMAGMQLLHYVVVERSQLVCTALVGTEEAAVLLTPGERFMDNGLYKKAGRLQQSNYER